MRYFPLLLLLFLSGESLSDELQCQNRNGLFPKAATACRGYFRCTNWVPEEFLCPPEQHFDPYLKYCNWKEFYPCIEVVPVFQCPLSDGSFPKRGSNCKSFYKCINNQPYEKHCPEDQLFSPQITKCEWPELHSCNDDDDEFTTTNHEISISSDLHETSKSTKNFEDFTTTDESASHPFSDNPTTIEKEISESNTVFEDLTSTTKQTIAVTKDVATSSKEIVSEEVTKDVDTSPNREEYTDSTSGGDITDFTSLTTAKTIVTNLPGRIECPSITGLFPHPTDKHKFISCVSFIPYEMDCPEDLVYEPIVEACIWQ